MKQNKRTKGPVLSILMGVFCFLLLTFLLYSTQAVVTYQLRKDDAMAELTQIRDKLASKPQQEDLEQVVEVALRQKVQTAALLLADGPISNEKLAFVAEQEMLLTALMVFREDGTLLHSYGAAQTDPDFLCRLVNQQVERTEDGHPFLAMKLEDDLYLAVGTDIVVTERDYQQLQYDMDLIAEIADEMVGNIVVANRSTGRVLYGPDSMMGKRLNNFLEGSVDDEVVLPLVVVDHSVMFASVLKYNEYTFLSLFDVLDLLNSLHSTVVPALLGFGFLIFLLLAYTEFIRTDMCRGWLGKINYAQFGKKHYVNVLLLRKLVGFAMIGITCMICAVYCLQLMIRSDEQRQNAENRLDIAAHALEENQTFIEEIEKENPVFLTEMAREAQAMLEINPGLHNEEGLNTIARLLNVNGICTLDNNGQIAAATTNLQDYSLVSNTAEYTHQFWNVINGFSESHVQIVHNDPYNQNNDMAYAGVSVENGQGMLLIAVGYDLLNSWQQMYSVEAVLETIGVDSQSTLLAVEAGTTNCVYDSSGQYKGLQLDAYGIEEAFLRNGYSGSHQFDGKDCLITTRSVLDWHLLYITPTSRISSSSWLFTALVIITGLFVVMVAITPSLLVHAPGEDLRMRKSKEQSARHRSRVDASFDRDGQIELVEHQIEHHTLRKRWRGKRASEKLGSLIKGAMVVLGGCLLIFLLFGRHTGNHPLLDRILAQIWDKTLNVYAISYVVIGVAGVWIIAEMLQKILLFVTGTFSRRWKTSGILISNVIRYAALIVSIFFTLKNFGVQTSTLATSASLLTLIFGLGCQNFVADLVAGVFLLFEGAFRVGDIVTIDNWHGEVIEIGLRSTKVKNEIGNVKVFQNSRISGAINMTRDLTFAVCDIPLPPGEMLEVYENKLTTSFFPEAVENIESIRHPLIYEGVVGMNGDNATLRISVKCLEKEREQIKRELYRELKLWRERNNKKPPANA